MGGEVGGSYCVTQKSWLLHLLKRQLLKRFSDPNYKCIMPIPFINNTLRLFFKLIDFYLISYLMHSHSKGMKIEKATENGSWI